MGEASIDSGLLQGLLQAAPDAVTICDMQAGEKPVIFANPAVEILTGFPSTELCGRNLRFLQGDDREQEALACIRSALRDGVGCRTSLRNYRRDGSMFVNDVTLVPLRDTRGELTHFAGFHRLGAERARSEPVRDASLNTQSMLAYLRDDKTTGLLRRPYFEELLRRDWALAQRENRRLSFMIFELDYFAHYREVFGCQGAAQSFRRIARVVGGCFRRASDLCGHFSDDQVAAMTMGIDTSQAVKIAETVLARVRDLSIHHPRSSSTRYLTASAGVVTCVPHPASSLDVMFEVALGALYEARDSGRNRVVCREFS
jgi:diguanylate cyclase (GGDEF)-like protein/PAS domain S-box-containing protein